MLADLESLERRIAQMDKKAKGGDKEARDLFALAERSLGELRAGRPARAGRRQPRRAALFQSLGLLSSKPALYVCNVEEASADEGNAFSDEVARTGGGRKARPRSSCRRRSKARSPCCRSPSRPLILRRSD